jgi:phospholipid transport system substrate-binding protein
MISTTIRRLVMGTRFLAMRRWLGAMLALAALIPSLLVQPGMAQPTSEQARDLVQTIGAEVLDVLQNDSLTRDRKVDRLIALLEGPIDLDLVARLILGRYWRAASEEQRQEYLRLFRAFALDSLASKLHVYQGQEFEVTGARVVSDNDAVVSTRILSPDRPPLDVDWRLRQRDDGDLVAIDVIVAGVSLIVTQRSEFGAVVERQGVEGLLSELRQRVRA